MAAGWCCLVLAGADWGWLVQPGAGWCSLVLVGAAWCWRVLAGAGRCWPVLASSGGGGDSSEWRAVGVGWLVVWRQWVWVVNDCWVGL